MKRPPELEGDRARRRAGLVQRSDLVGLEHASVLDTPKAGTYHLELHFGDKETAEARSRLRAWIDAVAARPHEIRVFPEQWSDDPPRVQEATRHDETLVLRVDRLVGQSRFKVHLPHLDAGGTRIDPAFDAASVTLPDPRRVETDCLRLPVAPVQVAPEIPLPGVTKDYAGFRAALLERLRRIAPDWSEQHEADLGVTLVELLAYAGDRLSYYQDAVATEAYLETAQQRISVRRHARLIDYQIYDGVSARTILHLAVDHAGTVPAGTQALGRIDDPLGDRRPPHPPVLDAVDVAALLDANRVPVFETLNDLHVDPRLNQISIHTWDLESCQIPAGARSLDLEGDLTECLRPGDLLLLEQARSPVTGEPQDADPNAAWTVRLTHVEPHQDPLKGLALTRVRWGLGDALRRPLSLTQRDAGGRQICHITVARGNLVLADHGRTVADEVHPGPPPASPGQLPRAHRFVLRHGPLSQCVPAPGNDTPVSALWSLPPHRAEPQIKRVHVPGSPDPDGWTGRRDLIDSDPFDAHFVVETDNQGRAHVRFGNGTNGQRPPEGETITVQYRVGTGARGNVGSGALAHLVRPSGDALRNWPVLATGDPERSRFSSPVRNPLPAWGGQDPETIEHAKRVAPRHFRNNPLVAVTEPDYVRLARKHPEVHDAVARLEWTGSWTTARIYIDPKGQAGLSPGRRHRIQGWMESVAPVGTPIHIQPPAYVPLDLSLEVRFWPGHAPLDVQQSVLEFLGIHQLPDGSQGFFHPDRFTFGQTVHQSHLYGAVEQVVGVESLRILHLRRLDGRQMDGSSHRTNDGLAIRAHEIVRLDNDPAHPENGRIQIKMVGAP